MRRKRAPQIAFTAALSLATYFVICCTANSAFAGQAPSAVAANKAIGVVKSINGTTITLTPDSGADVNISVQTAAQILRIAPGATSLSNAAPIQLQDLHVGDRIRATGQFSDDKTSLVAAKIIAISQSDLEAKHRQDLQDWQKRGVDGLASAVDSAAGNITISVRNKNVVIHSAPNTIIRRYPPDSIKFDDAKPATLKEVRVGDQVRARGERSADGGELGAEEIVSGSFRNIAGIVNTIDTVGSTLEVHDLLSKKNLKIKITSDSQLRHLSPELAQRIAARLKSAAAGGSSTEGSSATTASAARPTGTASGMGAAQGGRGAPDFQQMLSRIPASSLADLHKGDAIVAVSTEGTAEDGGTAITLLSGVEPILQSAPGASSSSILTPWSLSAPGGDSGGP